jgi:alkyldihydroxyacetonephosphate synthase
MADEPERRRKHWGWGFEDQQPDRAGLEAMIPLVRERLGFEVDRAEDPVSIEAVELAPPRLAPPEDPALAGLFAADRHTRLSHAMGKAYRDVVRGFRGRYERTPDMVARPAGETDLERVLDWCESKRLAVIPYGGGTSVAGGVEPRVGHGYRGTVTVDLGRMNRVLEIDETSNAARIEGGALGPELEAGLGERGLTLRHFPQSFEYSTLGGWIATRAGGHFATLYTHIDDFVESLRVVTPAGIMESRRLPGSGAGPSPDRLMIGAEGALGVITEAWMRLQDRPAFRAGAAVAFDDFLAGARAVRAVGQAGLFPSNLRLVDAAECAANGVNDGSFALLVLAFESADHPVDPWQARALQLIEDHGGRVLPDPSAAEAWRTAFIRMPYQRELLVPRNLIVDTFETAITWDRLDGFHEKVKHATEHAILEATGRPGLVTCRFTHVYPDGAAPYFSFHAAGRPGALIEHWRQIKERASDAVIEGGGTITHHHAVGRDHMPWYERQRPPLFGAALAAAKRALDPAGILNPGVLLPVERHY